MPLGFSGVESMDTVIRCLFELVEQWVGIAVQVDFALQERDVVEVSVDAKSLEEAEERHQATIKAKEGEIETL